MSAKRIQIPPRLGGGDFVMREISAGEHGDKLKSAAGAKADSGAFFDVQDELVIASIVSFKGKPLPLGSEKEAWWRALSAAVKQFLMGCYNKMNTTTDKEIEDFFDAAEAVEATGA